MLEIPALDRETIKNPRGLAILDLKTRFKFANQRIPLNESDLQKQEAKTRTNHSCHSLLV